MPTPLEKPAKAGPRYPTTKCQNKPKISDLPKNKNQKHTITELPNKTTTPNKPEKSNQKHTITELQNEPQASDLPKDAFAIVCLHGLMMSADESNKLVTAAQAEFGHRVIAIQPKCREGLQSIHPPLDEQAKRVVSEIKKTLRKDYPQCSEEELNAIPINLFGHSQGGDLAIILANNHRHKCNINSIIAAHAPLSGAYVLENSSANIDDFNKKAAEISKKISNYVPYQAKIVAAILNGTLMKQLVNKICKGMAALRINSDDISRIKDFIREGKHNIPILLIAGSMPNPNKY